MNFKPFTPVRKRLPKLDLFRPFYALGKRRRDRRDHDVFVTTQSTSINEHKLPPTARNEMLSVPARNPVRVRTSHRESPPACLALQTEDSTEEDVVVITTLNTFPFCCHEDLLTMSRDQLISVALTLNTKLPAALKIDVSHSSPDTRIRNSIEFIVGLRSANVPPAPTKAVRLLPNSGLSGNLNINDRSPPTSPLARRNRRSRSDVYASLVGSPPRLAKLVEEDEDAMLIDDRPAKRRRVSAVPSTNN